MGKALQAHKDVMDLTWPEQLISSRWGFFYHIITAEDEIMKRALKPEIIIQ
ncbi:MAG: hypothetical protein MI921_19040 [Cytophagales bacterium]|nr:hypothetical protein [Cytophagales bacterium]